MCVVWLGGIIDRAAMFDDGQHGLMRRLCVAPSPALVQWPANFPLAQQCQSSQLAGGLHDILLAMH